MMLLTGIQKLLEVFGAARPRPARARLRPSIADEARTTAEAITAHEEVIRGARGFLAASIRRRSSRR